MIVVACSGFPVPVSKYWGEFPGVEISDTERGLPGAGTVRRWVRESPRGFAFSLIAPGALGATGFQKSKETKETVEALAELAETLSAHAVVFGAPEDFKHTKAGRAALNAFAKTLPAKMPTPVFDLPAWKPAQVTAAIERPVVAAYDPQKDVAPPLGRLAYLRLPGPAGHRSRYDDGALESIAASCRALDQEVETVFCVFRNIDMHANAQQLLKLIG